VQGVSPTKAGTPGQEHATPEPEVEQLAHDFEECERRVGRECSRQPFR
jgi:hypothetical protein